MKELSIIWLLYRKYSQIVKYKIIKKESVTSGKSLRTECHLIIENILLTRFSLHFLFGYEAKESSIISLCEEDFLNKYNFL